MEISSRVPTQRSETNHEWDVSAALPANEEGKAPLGSAGMLQGSPSGPVDLAVGKKTAEAAQADPCMEVAVPTGLGSHPTKTTGVDQNDCGEALEGDRTDQLDGGSRPARPVPRAVESPPASHPASAQLCQGCGGAKYNPQDFNRPGGQDELIQQLG